MFCKHKHTVANVVGNLFSLALSSLVEKYTFNILPDNQCIRSFYYQIPVSCQLQKTNIFNLNCWMSEVLHEDNYDF